MPRSTFPKVHPVFLATLSPNLATPPLPGPLPPCQLETLKRDLAGEKEISSSIAASYQQAQLELDDIVKTNGSLVEQAEQNLRDANSDFSGAEESHARQLEDMAAERDQAHAHTAELRSQVS